MNLKEWRHMLDKMTNDELTYRELTLNYSRARLWVPDETHDLVAEHCLSVHDFLEAVCRCADSLLLPTVEEMHVLCKTTDVTHFFHSLKRQGDAHVEEWREKARARTHDDQGHTYVDGHPQGLDERVLLFLPLLYESLQRDKTLNGARECRAAVEKAKQKAIDAAALRFKDERHFAAAAREEAREDEGREAAVAAAAAAAAEAAGALGSAGRGTSGL